MFIPSTIPSFTTGDYSITNLQNLSTLAGFVSNYSYVPAWRFIRASTDVVMTSGTWNIVQYNTVEYDPDNTWNPNIYGAQINTQGYYIVESCIQFIQTAANEVVFTEFYLTIGGSNPNYSPGTTLSFGMSGGSLPGGSTVDYTFCLAAMCPYVLYPNDQIQVRCYPTQATTLDRLTNSSATAGWFCPQFSGRWIRWGT